MVVIRIDRDSLQEGDSSFNYENEAIICNRCIGEVMFYDIEYETIIITHEEVEISRCPHCNAHGSFDFELEEFDEVHMI